MGSDPLEDAFQLPDTISDGIAHASAKTVSYLDVLLGMLLAQSKLRSDGDSTDASQAGHQHRDIPAPLFRLKE